MSLLELSFT